MLSQLPTYSFLVRSGSCDSTAGSEAGAEGVAEEDGRYACSICKERYEGSEEIKILPCMHQFHCECVDNWLRLKTTCPVCKMDAFAPHDDGQLGVQ